MCIKEGSCDCDENGSYGKECGDNGQCKCKVSSKHDYFKVFFINYCFSNICIYKYTLKQVCCSYFKHIVKTNKTTSTT